MSDDDHQFGGPVPHTLPPYIPTTVQNDIGELEDPENLSDGELYRLIKDYMKQADRETLEVVLELFREKRWYSNET